MKLTSPQLPTIREWHAATAAWWSDSVTGIWSSPMAQEIVNADVHGLVRLAMLVDDYYRAETARERSQLSGEIRLCGAAFGLDPTSRRKLGWRVATEPQTTNTVMKYLTKRDSRDVLRGL